MQVLIFMSALLLVSAKPKVMRSGLKSDLSDERLPELQTRFRSELNQLIDSVLNSPSEIAQEMGETIDSCWSDIREYFEPCKTCALDNCGQEFVDKIAPEMIFNKEKRFLWTALGLANAITEAYTGKSAIGWGWHYTQQWLGKRSLGDMMNPRRSCVESCPSCREFTKPRRDLITRVCGPDFFLDFAPVAEDVELLEDLKNRNDETNILIGLDNTSDRKLEVEALFPSGPMTYISKVRRGPKMAAMLAREYFIRFFKQHDE